jgi:hypothetical protein
MHPAPFLAPPAPTLAPLSNFAQPCPLSSSTHAVRPRRRPGPAVPVIQSTGSHARPPQAPPRGETPVPMLGFPNCASLLANFGFTGGWPWRPAAPAWWQAKLARSSAPVPTPGVPLALLKIVQTLAHLRPPPRGRIPHRSYPDLPGVLPQSFSPL